MAIEIQMFTGDDLVKDADDAKPLINGVLWERDVMMLLGSEKAGKSIIAMQLMFSLTSGQSFLDKYSVPVPVPCVYFQTEGKRGETASRIKRMGEALEYNKDLLFHFYKKCFPLDLPDYMVVLRNRLISLPFRPKVLVLDSFYTTMRGDLIDNTAVRSFFDALSRLADEFELTIIIIHHESKEQFDDQFNPIERGDKGSYGSVFIRAFVEHIIYLKKHRDKSRTLTCGTQRTGQVMDKEDLILVEPTPLYFEVKGDYAPYVQVCWHAIQKKDLTKKQVAESTGLTFDSVEKAFRVLVKDSKVSFYLTGQTRIYHPRSREPMPIGIS